MKICGGGRVLKLIIRIGWRRKQSKEFKLGWALKYACVVEYFVKKMPWFLHVTCVAPAGETEMCFLLVRNGSGANAHLGMEKGRIFTVFHYHNGRGNMEGIGEPIARNLDSTPSNLLTIFLVFLESSPTAIASKGSSLSMQLL